MITRYRSTGVTQCASSRPVTGQQHFTQSVGYSDFANLVSDRTCDADATTVEEVADILGTLIKDLKDAGIVSA